MKSLDVSTLPRDASYGEGQLKTSISYITLMLRGAVKSMAHAGVIDSCDGLGIAVAEPATVFSGGRNWNNPYEFLWFVDGWGQQRDRYIANAVRELRATLRCNMDTMLMRSLYPYLFEYPVDSVEEDGTFLWGDFPRGGATFVQVGTLVVPCAVSGLPEVQNDFVAKLFGGAIGAKVNQINFPDEFGPDS